MTVQNQTRTLSQLSLREIVDGIGQTVMTVELGGDIRIATLRGVRVNTKNEIQSIVVNDGFQDMIWPTQWSRAVFA